MKSQLGMVMPDPDQALDWVYGVRLLTLVRLEQGMCFLGIDTSVLVLVVRAEGQVERGHCREEKHRTGRAHGGVWRRVGVTGRESQCLAH